MAIPCKVKEMLTIEIQTGCPRHEKIIPPMAAETMTTTKSDINLQKGETTHYSCCFFSYVKQLTKE